MKVALVVPGGVDRGGTERVIPSLLWLVERLARVHELHVFALRQEPRPGRWELLGAQIHNVGGRPVQPRALAALLAEHRRGPFDVLHGAWAGSGVVTALAGWLLRRPVLLHMPGGDLTGIPDIGYGRQLSRRGRLEVRLAVAGAHRVTVPSEHMVRQARALGITAERLAYGVSVRDWPPLPPRPRAPGEPARLLFVATLNRVKDPWTLLRALRRLHKLGVDFTLDVAGGDTLDGEVQRFATELGLADRVCFHGWLPQSRLRPLVERAHVLLVTSRHEGDPVAALEAAVAGVALAGTAVGHLADWAPEAGVAVPVGDSDALAGALAALLADDERRLRLAAEAQRRALAIDADHAAARVLEIYDELASR